MMASTATWSRDSPPIVSKACRKAWKLCPRRASPSLPSNCPIATVIHVDDQEFSWEDFGRMLCTYAGWGVRLVFVPDDELERAAEDCRPGAGGVNRSVTTG